ncbi:MAG TPA: DUF1259 domain-containing protein [Gemmatimonadales bacterium]|jgi:hypothetical protein
MKALRVTVALVIAASPLSAQAGAGQPWDSIGKVLGAAPQSTGGYYRYNFPRRDITLHVGDVTVAPQLALGTYVGISGSADDATAMGDLVVLPSEIKDVLAELSRQHVGVTAIHNHIVGAEPAIMYVHYHAHGNALDLGGRLRAVIGKTGALKPAPAALAKPLSIDSTAVFTALGPGRATGDVAQVSFLFVPGTLSMAGHVLNPALAYGSPINIQQVSPTRAVATGDFAIVEAKVQPLIDTLASHGITATAMHTHLIGETPKVYYIHFWADASLADVLSGLKAAVGVAR